MLTSMYCGKTQALKWVPALVCAAFVTLSPGARAAPDKPAYPHSVIPEAEAFSREHKLSSNEMDNIADRKKILTELYDRLRKAEDEPTAAIVAKAIEKLWLRSGSATVDLLMNRAGALMLDEDHEVALKILNSVIEIAPAYTEGWNRRAALLLMQELGDKKAALKAFRHALNVHPHLEDLRQSEQELAREVEGQGI